MINPKILKLASLPETAGSKPHHPMKSGKAGDVFGPSFREFWHLAHKGLSLKSGDTPAPRGVHKSQLSELLGSFRSDKSKIGKAHLLDQLREGLLAKGKPLNKISLKQEDFPLLKELLLHLGFSEKRGEEIIKKLAENHPGGEILLSQFIQHIEALDLPTTPSGLYLEQSALPQLESALRILGLTPKQVEKVFSQARNEEGGLDLTQLVVKLKSLQKEMKEGPGLENRQVAFDQVSEKLERIGLHTPVVAKSGQLTLKDFIASLERVIGTSDKGDTQPRDIKGTIERILERASPSNASLESPASSTTLNKLKTDFPKVGETIIGSDEFLDRAAPFQRKGPFGPQAGKENKQAIHGLQKPDSPIPVKGMGLTAQVQEDHGSDRGLKVDLHQLQSEKTTFHVPSQTTGSSQTEAIHAIKQNQIPTRDVLPAYLVDQLGRQISRAIQKGDRVIRIQLKPPQLGVVKVAMDLKENVLKLGMITENSSVKELLLANVGDLREALGEQGVKLERMDVHIGDHSNQTLGDLKEGLKEGKGDHQDPKAGLSLSHEHWTDGETGSPMPFQRIVSSIWWHDD